MNHRPSSCRPGPGDDDADAALSRLLENLDEVLQDTRTDFAGVPLFKVEVVLNARLRAVLPGVRFSPEDIRGWAAEISS